ncbi:Protein mpe1 [Rhodotorula toruloides]|uniref:BY PROTMAP: gi/472586101/gb/EMS23643.1/ Mpe1-like protein [Rhodosporidium toruloides NP11] gi/647395494/emb/CDR36949.1/ RHTO0S02e08944g1_1 [Rhodosporidium toruloides] n=1 Tax=Rhodotorula toruloides TaxID=5286 RepID=A0A0K3C655_RHOTO|nr:DWNN domain-domain containing protein [Rhodotorula toruloides]
MSSSFVFYKFKSQREPSRIAFDGTAISVFDLKKEIIAENKMGKGADFDFAIYHADTEEEYTKDHELIPRSTSVIARRLPPSRPGRGNALKYMAGTEESGVGLQAGRGAAPEPRGGVGSGFSKDMFTKRFDGREDARPSPAQDSPQVQIPAAAPTDEASAMAAMFAATNSQWQQTQEQMSHATPVYRNPPPGNRPHGQGPGRSGDGGNRPSFRDSGMAHKPPPPGYICYRCGQKGHWIQECPTNGDAAYDNRPRIKRTTGIPKSFLTEVQGPQVPTGEEGDGPATNGVKSGIMVTAEGGFVVARPDSASWLAHRALTANLSANDIQNLAPTDPDLTCPVCSKLLRDAMLTPCCSTSFCDECVTNALLDNDMLCPECETRVKSLEKLKPDEGRRERVTKYVDEMMQASKEAAEEERKKLEAEEEQRKSAEAKRKAEEEAAAEKAAENGENGEEKEAVKEEDVKKEEEELFPAKPEEILNPRKPRPGEEIKPTVPAGSPAPVDSVKSEPAASASPPRAPSATPGLPAVPQIPPGALQAQQLRQQQQLRAQQQQQMLAMQQQQMMGVGAGGMGGMPSPQMIQQQMFQLSAMLQNPGLPPPMRMQLQAQLQQCQMMLVQMQQRMAMGMQGGRPGMMGGMSPMMGGMQQGGGGMTPAGSAGGAGQKRGREEDGGDASPAAKKTEVA